jgi:hypothetical protein
VLFPVRLLAFFRLGPIYHEKNYTVTQ